MPRNNLQAEVNEVKENGRRKIVITILAPEEDFLPGDLTDYQVLAEAVFPGRKAERMRQTEAFFLNASRDIFARMLEFEPNPEQLVAWLAHEEEIDRICAGTELANYIRPDAAAQRAGVLGSLARVGKTMRILLNKNGKENRNAKE